VTTAIDVARKIRAIELTCKDKELGITDYKLFFERIMIMKIKIMAGKTI